MKRFIAIAFLILLAVFTASAELVANDKFGWIIDFPEGFKYEDGSADESSLLFKHTMLDIEAFVKIWPEESYKSALEAIDGTYAKLSASGEVENVKWRGRDCAVGNLEMNLDGAKSGSSVCIPLPEKKGWFTMAAYSSSEHAFDLQQVIFSLLDSIMIDRGSQREPGIITTFAFPREKAKKVTLEIKGKKIQTQIDEIDNEASQFVVDREFAVFKFFSTGPLWKEAWLRFYRMIAKDGFLRVKQASFDIYAALDPLARKEDPENPQAAIAQFLLTWTQNFPYQQKSSSPDKADFTNVALTLTGDGSDCDSRSMLIMLLLKDMNIDSCMFISVDYSHAIAGVNLSGKEGQTITVDGVDYLVGETTDKGVTWGMLLATMQDRSKWFPVETL